MLKNRVLCVWSMLLSLPLIASETGALVCLQQSPNAIRVDEFRNLPVCAEFVIRNNNSAVPTKIIPGAVCVLDKQAFLNKQSEKELRSRQDMFLVVRGKAMIFSEMVKRASEKINERYIAQGFFPIINTALHMTGLSTFGCSIDGAVIALNDMVESIEEINVGLQSNQPLMLVEQLRSHNFRFDQFLEILHANMPESLSRNWMHLKGSTVDDMIYKKNIYPNLSEALRSYLRWKDEAELLLKWSNSRAEEFNIGKKIEPRILWYALMNSAVSWQELTAFKKSLLYTSLPKDPGIERSLSDFENKFKPKVNYVH